MTKDRKRRIYVASKQNAHYSLASGLTFLVLNHYKEFLVMILISALSQVVVFYSKEK